MTASTAAHTDRTPSGPALTIAWYVLVLAVVFTIAFWVGRMVGPAPVETERPPVAPHAPMEGH